MVIPLLDTASHQRNSQEGSGSGINPASARPSVGKDRTTTSEPRQSPCEQQEVQNKAINQRCGSDFSLHHTIAKYSEKENLNREQIRTLQGAVPFLGGAPNHQSLADALTSGAAGWRELSITDVEFSNMKVSDAVALLALVQKADAQRPIPAEKRLHPAHALNLAGLKVSEETQRYKERLTSLMHMLETASPGRKGDQRLISKSLCIFAAEDAHRGNFSDASGLATSLANYIAACPGIKFGSRTKLFLHYFLRFTQALSFAWAPPEHDAGEIALKLSDPLPNRVVEPFYRGPSHIPGGMLSDEQKAIKYSTWTLTYSDMRHFQYAFACASQKLSEAELAIQREKLKITSSADLVASVQSFVELAGSHASSTQLIFARLWQLSLDKGRSSAFSG